jgi:predicted protein tyrosine phosphatase
MNLLFICSRNRLRSPTAEALFTNIPGIETASAGTSPDADNPISLDLIEWADIIYVMERVHRQRLNSKFPKALKSKKLTVLNIPDNYDFMDPALISILKSKLARHLP